jgi:two-component system, OmpR family, sensor histidine kinase MprB
MAQLRADVLAELTKLSTLAGDLVDIAGGDACGVVHELADMSDVIDRSLKRVRRRRYDIEFNVAVTGWQVYGDAAGLYRTVTNLLDNAVKWSPPDGHVSVLLKQIDPSHAELVDADRGPGIPPPERTRVFERFYRGASARGRSGPVLGLAIVKYVSAKAWR